MNGLVIVVCTLSTFWFHAYNNSNGSSNLLAMKSSHYADLCVIDIAEQRHLFINGDICSRVDTSTWESVMPYCAVMELPKYFYNKPGTALVIGLGGGSLVKQYRHHGWKVDAIECDHEVIQLAKQYFRLYPSDGTIYESEGRTFLRSTSNTYDVILLDVFENRSNSFHLYTQEAFGLISSKLNANGILAVSIEAIGWYDPIVSTFAATLKSVFQDVLVLPIEEPPNKTGNLVLLASNSILEPKRFPQNNITLSPDWRYGPEYQKVHAWDNRFFPNIRDVRILTDDKNSLDIQWEKVNQAARQQLHEYITQNMISGIW
jgi:spermidine synthase